MGYFVDTAQEELQRHVKILSPQVSNDGSWAAGRGLLVIVMTRTLRPYRHYSCGPRRAVRITQ